MSAGAAQPYDSIPEPVIQLDDALRLIALNTAAEHFLGRSRSSAVGAPLSDVLHGADHLIALCQRAIEGDQSIRAYGLEIDRRFLGPAFCEVSISGVDPQGHVVVVLMDKADPAASLGALRGGQTSRSLQHLVSMMAHEIKNPLAGIKGAAQLLRQSAGADSDDAELAGLIVEEANRLSALVDQFDFFTDSVASNMAHINIHALLARVVGIAQNSFGKDVHFARRYDPSLPEIWGDKDRIVQVLLNLIKNACEAFDGTRIARASVTITTRYEHGNKVQLGDDDAVDAPLQVIVADNGPGIPHDIKQQIFEPFRTNKHQGTGLGLTIVSKILAEHHAAVQFNSIPGSTEFVLSFPMIRR